MVLLSKKPGKIMKTLLIYSHSSAEMLVDKENVYQKEENDMTNNQIAYWNMLENQRANRAREYENSRHNVSTETLGFNTLTESSRHNLATERVAGLTQQEQARHNRSTEGIAREQNQIGWWNAAINQDNVQFQHADRQSANYIASVNTAWQHQDRAMGNLIHQEDVDKQHEDRVTSNLNTYLNSKWAHIDRQKANSINKMNARTNVANTAETTRHNIETEKWKGVETIWGGINNTLRNAIQAFKLF